MNFLEFFSVWITAFLLFAVHDGQADRYRYWYHANDREWIQSVHDSNKLPWDVAELMSIDNGRVSLRTSTGEVVERRIRELTTADRVVVEAVSGALQAGERLQYSRFVSKSTELGDWKEKLSKRPGIARTVWGGTPVISGVQTYEVYHSGIRLRDRYYDRVNLHGIQYDLLEIDESSTHAGIAGLFLLDDYGKKWYLSFPDAFLPKYVKPREEEVDIRLVPRWWPRPSYNSYPSLTATWRNENLSDARVAKLRGPSGVGEYHRELFYDPDLDLITDRPAKEARTLLAAAEARYLSVPELERLWHYRRYVFLGDRACLMANAHFDASKAIAENPLIEYVRPLVTFLEHFNRAAANQRLTEANERYQQAAETLLAHESDPSLEARFGYAYFRMGNISTARTHLKAACEATKSTPLRLAILAVYSEILSGEASALEDYEQARDRHMKAVSTASHYPSDGSIDLSQLPPPLEDYIARQSDGPLFYPSDTACHVAALDFYRRTNDQHSVTRKRLIANSKELGERINSRDLSKLTSSQFKPIIDELRNAEKQLPIDKEHDLAYASELEKIAKKFAAQMRGARFEAPAIDKVSPSEVEEATTFLAQQLVQHLNTYKDRLARDGEYVSLVEESVDLEFRRTRLRTRPFTAIEASERDNEH